MNYFIIFTIMFLIFLNYEAFTTSMEMDFGIFRIIAVILDIGFAIGLISYFFSLSLSTFFFFFFLPIFLFYLRFGVDIPIIFKLIAIFLYSYWGYLNFFIT